MIEILEKPNTGRRRFADIPGDSYPIKSSSEQLSYLYGNRGTYDMSNVTCLATNGMDATASLRRWRQEC